MAGVLTFPPVTDQLLVEVVRRILTIGSPIKILLFGSHAKGTARPDSDWDLLIIEESDLPRYRRSGRYRRVLYRMFPAKDIVVWPPPKRSKNGRPYPMPSSPPCWPKASCSMKDRSALARGWFRKADSDLADARRTTASEGPYDTACFRAQQAVEK